MPGTSKIITGDIHEDARGSLKYFNDFDMQPVKRFYIAEYPEVNLVKAWQAHRKERKWLNVIGGAFKIVLVKVENWDIPSANVEYEEYVMEDSDQKILCVPGGFATGFQALTASAKLMIFSDFSLSESRADDFRFEKDLWYKW